MMVNTMHNTPFTDMNDSEGEVQQAGYSAFESGGRVLALMGALVPELSIQENRVAENTDKSCITITELADTLVRVEGISFRQAHHISAQVSKDVLTKKQTLAQGFNSFGAEFKSAVGRQSDLDQEAFVSAVSPRNFVDVRDRFGGPAEKPMGFALSGYNKELDDLSAQSKANSSSVLHAEELLKTEFSQLIT